jgi:hypothetical protein
MIIVVLIDETSITDIWKLKKLKELARYARFGKLKDDSFAARLATECAPHPKGIVL